MLAEERRKWCVRKKRLYSMFFCLCCLMVLELLFLATDENNAKSRQLEEIWELTDINTSYLMDFTSHQTYPPLNFTFTEVDFDLLAEHLRPTRAYTHLKKLNCQAMFNGNTAEISRAKKYMDTHPRDTISDHEYIRMASNCENFKIKRGYITQPLSREEYDFPIAFSLLMYKDVHQVERLLRAIYMPQNYYCIHVDVKASQVVHRAMRSISNCFPNIFVASKLKSVYWGHISIIHAEMSCLRDLMKYKWKYFINLSGQMYPLHTNRELVKILKTYNYANDIEGTYKRSLRFWLTIRQALSWRLWKTYSFMFFTGLPKGKPPYHVKIYKGSNQVALTRPFAVYLLYSKVANNLLEWFSDTLAPDEYLWPTLNHNRHLRAPGGFIGDPETKKSTVRATIWHWIANQVNWSWKHWDCQGKFVREICILGVGDLPWLYNRPELFANKFFSNFEYIGYDCMEQLHFNRTMQGNNRPFNLSYYQNLSFVRHKNLVIRPVKPWYNGR